MIVRVLTEAQYRVPDSLLERLNEIDNRIAGAVEAGDESALRSGLEELTGLVRREGTPLDAADLAASDLIVPPPDLSLDEAKQLFAGDGLIPDIPA